MAPKLAIPITGPTVALAEEQIQRALPYASLLEMHVDIGRKPPLASIFKFASPHADFVDLDWKSPPLPGVYKTIISYHNYEETPQDLHALLEKMKRAHPNAYLYKIATRASSTLDALRLLLFLREKLSQGERLLAIAMGEYGQVSRILSPVFQNPFTFAALDENSKTAPGQLTAQELIQTYSFSTLSPHTHLYGLIGDPVDKSSGHLYHNEAFRQKGFDGVYVKLRITPSELKCFFEVAKAIGFKGLSITMPLKEEATLHIPEKKSMGSINTVAHGFGYNTDAEAALSLLKQRTALNQKKVLLLGAGGLAKALAWALVQEKAYVRVANRSHARALALANVLAEPLDKTLSWECDILIQATSCGMRDDECIVEVEKLAPHTLVFECVAKETLLSKRAKARGLSVIEGKALFEEQAALQLKLWQVGCMPCACSRGSLPVGCSDTSHSRDENFESLLRTP